MTLGVYSNVQLKKKTGPKEANANLGGPELQLLEDKFKLILLYLLQAKTFRTIETDFRKGKGVVKKSRGKQKS